MKIIEKKYCVLYTQDKAIITLMFAENQSISTSHNAFGTNNYQDLVNFIYDDNLYEDNKSSINYKKLNRLEKNVKKTLFKYDD
tara:strand:+ start:484 stop:732 length:249 start_codon:yes stop_codon:yes gene_type:complete